MKNLLTAICFFCLTAYAPMVSAQAPFTNVSSPTYPAKDVTSFFSPSYTGVTTLYDVAVSWGAPARWEITTLADATETLKITNLGWLPLGLQNQVNITDKTYLHLDVYCPTDVASFQIGFHYFGHSGAGEERERYAPEIKNLKAGEWYSIDYPLIVFTDQDYNLKGINVLRFRSNSGTIPEIYIGNLYAFNGEPHNLLNYHTPNNDPRLKSLTVSEGELTPAFDAALFGYTLNLPETSASLTIGAEAVSSASTITGVGEKTLANGSNLFEIKVTAENGNALTYKIVVNRGTYTGIQDLVIKPLWSDDPNWSSSDYLNDPRYRLSGNPLTGIYTGTLELNRTHTSAAPDNTKYYYLIVNRATDGGSIKPGNARIFQVPADATQVTFYAKKETDGIRFVNDAQSMLAWVFASSGNDGFMVDNFSSATVEGKATSHLNLTFDTQIKFQVKAKKTSNTTDWGETEVWEDFYSPNFSKYNDGKISISAGEYNLAAYYNTLNVYTQDPDPTGIRLVKTKSAVNISVENGSLRAQFEGKATVRLYTIGGILINQTVAENEYRQAVLPGLYILSVDGKTYKVLITI